MIWTMTGPSDALKGRFTVCTRVGFGRSTELAQERCLVSVGQAQMFVEVGECTEGLGAVAGVGLRDLPRLRSCANAKSGTDRDPAPSLSEKLTLHF